MAVTLSESQLKDVIERLDAVRLGLLRLRALLLPEEEISDRDKRQRRLKARGGKLRGKRVALRELAKELAE